MSIFNFTTSPVQPRTKDNNEVVNDWTYPGDGTHRSILVIPNFLSEKGLTEIMKVVKDAPTELLGVFDVEAANRTKDTNSAAHIDKMHRVTDYVHYEPIAPQVKEMFKLAVNDFINPFYNVTVESAEEPQLLKYTPGGFYKNHVDSEAHYIMNGNKQWRKCFDRDMSCLIYLNDDYEGGLLDLPFQHMKLKPKAGMLVAFPSDHRYLHGAEMVTKGVRFAFVMWMKIKGSPGVGQAFNATNGFGVYEYDN